MRRAETDNQNLWPAALEESARAVASTDDPRSVLKVIAREIDRVMDVADCSIILLKDGGTATVLVSTESPPPTKDREIKIGDYPEILKVLETKQPLIIEDALESPLTKDVARILTKKRVRGMIVVPVSLAISGISGVLFIRLSRKVDSQERASLPFLRAIANVAALALRNLILKESLKSEAQEKEEARAAAEQEEHFRQHYQELFHAASDGIVIIDSRGKIVDVNRKFETLTGYSTEEFKSLTYLDLVPEQSHERARDFLREYRRKPLSVRAQFPIRVKSGEIRQMMATVEPLGTSPGQALLAFQDVTEERELENQLRRTKDFLENLVQNSADAILAADMKGTILIFNEAAERISGYKAVDVIGKFNVINFYAPGGAKDAMRRLRSPEYGGIGKLESSHYTIISKVGEEIPVNVSASIIYEDGGEIATVGIFLDLRERIRIEKELRAVQERLIETEKQAAIAELSGAAAHELNQPLTSIMGYAELLAKRVASGDEASLKAVTTINQEAERMAEIVKKISQVSAYHTKDYVGRARIIDLDRASNATSRYENLFLSLRDGLLEFSMDKAGNVGECIFANPSAISMFGFSSVSNLIGVELKELLVSPEDISIIENPLKESGSFDMIIFRARRADRSEIYISASGNVVEAEKSGRIVELLCREVTSRVEMENELRRLKEFNESIVNNAPVGIVTIDKNCTILSINDRDREIMGTPDKSLIVGRNMMELPTVKGTEIEQLLKKSLAGEHISVPYMDYTSLFGKKLVLRVEGIALKDDKGEVAGGIIIFQDVTEERRAHLELEVISEISRAATQGKNARELLKALVKQLRRIFDFDGLSLVRPGDIENQYRFEALYVTKGINIPKEAIIKARDSITKHIISDRKPRRVDDYAAMTNLLPDEKTVLKAGLRSSIIVPLITQDRSLGTLNMASLKPNAYSEKDVDFFRYVADEFAVALQNTILVDELREKNIELVQKSSYLETLLRAGRGLRVTMKEEEIVNRFVENIEMLFPSPHILVSLVDTETGSLKPIFARQLPGEAVTIHRPFDPQIKNWIQQGHDHIYYPSLGKVKGYAPDLPDAKSALVVPLQAGGELLGVLRAESHHVNPFSGGDVDLFVLLAQQMSSTLRNARLFEQAKHLERQQEELIENANALIGAVSVTGAVTIFNRAFEQFTGQYKDEIIGKNIWNLFNTDRNSERFRNVTAFLRSEQPLSNFVIQFKHKKGEWIKGVFNAGIQRDASGKVQQYVFVGYDVTERELLERQLLQSAKMASLGQMAASVAHELSNPLTYISSFAQLLSMDWERRGKQAFDNGPENWPRLEPNDLDRLKKILQGVDRIEKMVSNLMSFSRLDGADSERVDINAILEQALSFTEYELSRGKIKIIREFGKDIPEVMGVASQLQQLFINLLTNAGHALREKGGGQITVRSSSALQGLAQIEVIDDGPGIPPEMIAHIFEPFFTTKTKGDGTGLGLSIVHNIAQKHGGQITVNSKPGEGTTFTITLPAANNK